MAETISYTPPPTVKSFLLDHKKGALFYDWIVGPLGSGKTTGLFFKLIVMAKKQQRSPDGVRRTRAVIVRSTMPQLKDTTIKSWDTWFRGAGTWALTERTFTLRFDDVECEVLFRALDTPEDVAKVLSLEVSFAILDEFIAIPKAVVEALSGRLGRFPAQKDGGCTNWGMWGSSNPGTEDIWWYDHLHDETITEQIRLYGTPERTAKVRAALELEDPERNTRYFIQPSGRSEDAENLPNLPGGAGYYANQEIGKSPAWIKQYLDAEWGFSASETPVIKTFSPVVHIAKAKLRYNKHLPLVGGFDPGLGGTAMVLGQEDLHGRLLMLGEIGAVGMGVTRFLNEKLKPYLRYYFPEAQLVIAPDPASINRGQTDEVSVLATLKKHFAVSIETNNQLAKRIDAIESYTTRNTEMGPALLLDREMCPNTARAFAGGWRFGMVPKGDTQKPAPDKNSFSHWGDAAGYLARYFHKQFEKGGERGVTLDQLRASARVPMSAPAPRYHIR